MAVKVWEKNYMYGCQGSKQNNVMSYHSLGGGGCVFLLKLAS